MNYKVDSIAPFDRQLKKLQKKYPSLKQEMRDLGSSLSMDPKQGVALGNNCYKIRIAIRSKGKGKSGGARVISYVFVAKTTVYLISIYDKSEQPDISDNEIMNLVSLL